MSLSSSSVVEVDVDPNATLGAMARASTPTSTSGAAPMARASTPTSTSGAAPIGAVAAPSGATP
jgi:hypothetical protein